MPVPMQPPRQNVRQQDRRRFRELDRLIRGQDVEEADAHEMVLQALAQPHPSPRSMSESELSEAEGEYEAHCVRQAMAYAEARAIHRRIQLLHNLAVAEEAAAAVKKPPAREVSGARRVGVTRG